MAKGCMAVIWGHLLVTLNFLVSGGLVSKLNHNHYHNHNLFVYAG